MRRALKGIYIHGAATDADVSVANAEIRSADERRTGREILHETLTSAIIWWTLESGSSSDVYYCS